MAKTYDVLAGGIARKPKKQYDVLDGGLTKRVKKEYIVDRNPAYRNLPEGYTQREYIESTGAQRLNTGFVPNQNTRVVADFQFTTTPTAHWGVFGARSSQNDGFFVFGYNATAFRTDYNATKTFFSTAIGATERLVVDKNKNVTTLNGETITETAGTFSAGCTLYLDTINTAGDFGTNTGALKRWSTQIYDNGTLVRDYVPCTDSSGIAGLYDMVHGTFTGSETDTPFVAGPVVHEKQTYLVYLGQQTGSISVSPASLSIIGKAGTTKTATITKTGTGAVTATSSNSGVATVTVSGNTVTVKQVASGSATITLNLAATDDYTAASCTIAVTAKVLGTLDSTDWATIKSVSSIGANCWSVGDKKAVAVSGKVGVHSISGTYYAYILGFNHNSSIEGNGIHFQFGFTSASGGRQFAFCDSIYGDDGKAVGYKMYLDAINTGGWANSYMNNTLCPAFLSALPADLQNVISACTKYSDNTGGTNPVASAVTASSSKIWLLAEYEVHGTTTYANSAEKNYQKQYAYYANGNSKIRYKNTTSTAIIWWTRSTQTSSGFCAVAVNGSAIDGGYSYYSRGFAPAFKVAA